MGPRTEDSNTWHYDQGIFLANHYDHYMKDTTTRTTRTAHPNERNPLASITSKRITDSLQRKTTPGNPSQGNNKNRCRKSLSNTKTEIQRQKRRIQMGTNKNQTSKHRTVPTTTHNSSHHIPYLPPHLGNEGKSDQNENSHTKCNPTGKKLGLAEEKEEKKKRRKVVWEMIYTISPPADSPTVDQKGL